MDHTHSNWMITEFFMFDSDAVYGDISYKYLAVSPVTLGILILAYYYLWWKPTHKGTEETMVNRT